LDARFGVFNYKVLPNGKKANRQHDIVTPTQFQKKVEEVYTQNEHKGMFPGFDFVDIPHTLDFKSWLEPHLVHPFPFKFRCTKAKDHSWDKLQMSFMRDASSGTCYIKYAEPWPESKWYPAGNGHKILKELPNLVVGPPYAPFKMYKATGKAARVASDDSMHWVETSLAKAIKASCLSCCNTDAETQEWRIFFENVPKTPDEVPEGEKIIWNWVSEEQLKYKDFNNIGANILERVNNAPRNETLQARRRCGNRGA